MQERSKGSLFVVGLALFTKAAKLLKLLKVAKPMLMFITMSISAIAYAFLFGPWLAILFVVLLLIHEMGHVVAMRMRGYDTPTPVFIPFLGAAIFAPKFGDRDTEAFVGFGGPLLGTIGTLAVLGAWFVLPRDTPLSHILLVGSYLGAFLNLFNLLPISPLDGGRVTQAVGQWFKYIGLTALAVFSVLLREPVILYIWILVLFEFRIIPLRWRAGLITGCWLTMATLMALGFSSQPMWLDIFDCVITLPFVIVAIVAAVRRENELEEPDTRPDLTPSQRWAWFGMYAGLALFLIATMLVQVPHLPQPPQ
ncbi:MAG TPA: hypothetical protein VEB18_01835 [Candidatus Paceibacterota bacterium]|nr:hypothetical protein [Candidatus Paceibacterota bacterium]